MKQGVFSRIFLYPVSITIQIPTALRKFANEQGSVRVEARTVGEAMEQLTTHFSGLRPHLYSTDGKLRNFVRIYLNDEDITALQKTDTPVRPGDTLMIVPAVAGGAESRREKLTHEEIKRYSRHLIMPEVGVAGQEKLKAAKVLLVGAGGLGSPLGLYLAAAGVGTIGMVDFDAVDFSNLQRQVIHGTKDVGRPKLDSARDRIADINPNVKFLPHPLRLSSENAMEILRDYDIVVNGCDNFPTRYLINDACVLLKKPNVDGCIFRFEGQATVYAPHLGGPCYRCLFPEPPPPGMVPSCAEGGVIGILPGLIGLVQAQEVVKLILGKGEPLIGRLLLLDAMAMKWKELKIRKDPACPACGQHPTITGLMDYNQFCGIRGEEAAPAQPRLKPEEISVEELKRRLDTGEPIVVLDVREQDEWDICHIEGAKLVPLSTLPDHIGELKTNGQPMIVLHCHKGVRSMRALHYLRSQGIENVKSLAGGIDAWAEKIQPNMARY